MVAVTPLAFSSDADPSRPIENLEMLPEPAFVT